MLRAGLGEQVAVARSEIAEADAMIAQEKVENMTQCDESTSMLQCGSGYAQRFHFAGKSAAPLQNFKSKAAMLARERAARMALKKPLNQFAYKNHHKKHHLNLASGKKLLGKRALKQAPEVAPEAEGVNKTTEASDDVLESIENLTVAAMPEPVSYDPNDHIGKCSVSGSPMCPMLRDALSQLTAEIRWARDIAAQGLAETEAECKRLAEEYKQQSDDWSLILQEANTKFATSTGNLNTAEEAIRLKVDEANALIEELTTHRADCADKIKDGAEALCGIKTIRQELFQIQGENPLIVDCEVTEWQEGECSVECAGGIRQLTRTVVTMPTGGAECPPLVETETCNTQACPIDCQEGDWSGWSECSKDCGSGVMSRTRIPVVEEANGGRACGQPTEQVACNVDACDKPCTLEDWNEWSTCTKACDWGYQLRQRGVAEEAGPTGYCPESWDWDRLQAQWCAEFYCPPDLTCSEKMDLVVLVDGSGSVEWEPGGFRAEQQFTKHLFDLLEFGEDKAKAGVVLFSWEAELIADMSTDRDALKSAVEAMNWPGWNTDTAAGLSMAGNVLTAGGRPDVSKERTLAFLITDGNPNDMMATNAAAETFKERGRLVVVPVGGYIDYDSVMGWASYPAEENVMAVDEFPELQKKITNFLADLCSGLECSEHMTGNGQDYHGCQDRTEQYPHSHSFIVDWYPDAHLGDHNFCRNPDGDSTIWCYTTDPGARWNYCDTRVNAEGMADTSVPENYYPTEY